MADPLLTGWAELRSLREAMADPLLTGWAELRSLREAMADPLLTGWAWTGDRESINLIL